MKKNNNYENMKYIIEMVAPSHDYKSWRWKQIYLSPDLENAKELINNKNKYRILDINTLEEVYNNAPLTHFGMMEAAYK